MKNLSQMLRGHLIDEAILALSHLSNDVYAEPEHFVYAKVCDSTLGVRDPIESLFPFPDPQHTTIRR